LEYDVSRKSVSLLKSGEKPLGHTGAPRTGYAIERSLVLTGVNATRRICLQSEPDTGRDETCFNRSMPDVDYDDSQLISLSVKSGTRHRFCPSLHTEAEKTSWSLKC